MSGKKGRSGLAVTAEAKRARSDAARKRWGQPPAGAFAPGAPGQPPTSLDQELRTIADHDAQIGRPVTWGDALKRLQLIEQDIINERREVELDTVREDLAAKRGARVDRSELERVVAKIRDAWWREVQQIAGLSLLRLADLPGEVRARVKAATDAEVSAAAERVKSSLV